MPSAQWVFDCDAPLEEFGQRMRAALQRRGWSTGPAQLHDFASTRGNQRAWVKLVYHDWGVQVNAKMKHGLFGSPGPMQKELWEAGREAQVGLAAEGFVPRAPPSVRTLQD